jgi:hypothetical protein
MGAFGQCHALAALLPVKIHGTHYTGDKVGSRAGLDRHRKSHPPPPGFDPWTIQPIASHYTDYNILVHTRFINIKII